MITRDDALARDAADPLAGFRSRFHIPSERLVYLDGNSLGMPPRTTLDALEGVYREDWSNALVRSWDHWIDLPQRVGDTLAPLIGARPGEVVVHDTTTMNLYQLVHAAIALRPHRRVIAVGDHDFPTDRYVVDGIAERTGHLVRHDLDHLDDVAVVVRSLVDYRTAQLVDLAEETARAREAGALVLWDLSHAVGAIEVDLHGAGAELAVGCTYKFLNGGPGAPAFSYVARHLQTEIQQPIWGWFAAVDQFAMGPTFEARPDITRLLLGTPSILALTAAACGIELTAEAGMSAIEAKGRALTAFALDLCDQLGFESPTPRDPAARGQHVAIAHPDAEHAVRRLAAADIVFDFRQPNLVRAGCSPLTTRFVDVFDGLQALADDRA